MAGELKTNLVDLEKDLSCSVRSNPDRQESLRLEAIVGPVL